jgi:thioredoxin 1
MKITDLTFEEETKSGISVIDFWAEWCGPCRTISPIIDGLVESYKEKGVKIFKLNVDESSETTSKFNIRSIPTIVVLKDGVEVGRHTGSGPIVQKIEELVTKAKS